MLISKKTQSGFSMVEVLVSLVVIGIGLLGLSGLQIASMKGTNNAHSRNIATILAMELSDRMRANPNAINVDGVGIGFYDNDVNCSKDEGQCRTTSFCTPQEIARLDVQEVMCGVLTGSTREGGVANLLTAGALQISCVGGCDVFKAEHDITISWSDFNVQKDQIGSNQAQSLTINVLP